jgi:tripartite-type tricarboxylate transporter receptor subunit TctC
MSHARIQSALLIVAAAILALPAALAVTRDKRYPTMPEVPTLAESALPGFNTGSWIGIVAPAGTSRNIVDKVARDVREIVTSVEVRDPLIAQGATPMGSTPQEFAALIDSDRKRYAQIIRERNITAE